MWREADKNNLVLHPITNYGWTLRDGKLTIIWDTPSNLQAVRERVSLLLRGCKCATGCSTGRCGCKKSNRQCSEGCQCKNCSNVSGRTEEATDLAEIAIVEELTTENTDIGEDTEELMEWVFGTELETISSDLEDEDNYESD